MRFKTAVLAIGVAGLIAMGCEGSKGSTGATGPAGPAGSAGPTGTQGQRGTTGNLSVLPVTGTVIFSLGGGSGYFAAAPYANPDTGSLYSYDLGTGALTKLGYSGYIETNALAVSPTAKIAYAGLGLSQSGQILKIDLTTGDIQPLISKIGVRRGVLGLTFSSNGALIATAADGGPGSGTFNYALITVDPNTGKGRLGTPMSGRVLGIGFSPNGTLVGFNGGFLRSINTTSGAVATIPGPQRCGEARGFVLRSSTEAIGAVGSPCAGGKPVLYQLNLSTGACTPITLTTFPYAASGCSGAGVTIAP